MSKKNQTTKNILLTQRLLNYLESIKFKSGYSYVVFSKNDKELNVENEKLAQGLKKEGKKIIKATETGNKENPWQFTYI